MNITNDYYFGIPDDDSSHDDFNTASNIFRFNDELRNYTSFDNQSSTSDLTPIQRAFPFEPIPKMEIFVVRKQKNRGRKKIPNKTKRRKHDKYEDGNVLTKIQVHYFKFLINYINDMIKKYIPNRKKFKQISYAIKKNINSKNIEELKATQIKDILQMKISNKSKKDETYNKNNYDEIVKLIEKDSSLKMINDIFEMNYLKFAKTFYISKSNYEKGITYSKETKSFNDLIEENKNDKKMKESLERVGEKYFKEDGITSQQIFFVERKKDNI